MEQCCGEHSGVCARVDTLEKNVDGAFARINQHQNGDHVRHEDLTHLQEANRTVVSTVEELAKTVGDVCGDVKAMREEDQRRRNERSRRDNWTLGLLMALFSLVGALANHYHW